MKSKKGQGYFLYILNQMTVTGHNLVIFSGKAKAGEPGFHSSSGHSLQEAEKENPYTI